MSKIYLAIKYKSCVQIQGVSSLVILLHLFFVHMVYFINLAVHTLLNKMAVLRESTGILLKQLGLYLWRLMSLMYFGLKPSPLLYIL